MEKIDPRNPPNEFPDIVGARPENPILANFRPFIPASARLREFTPLPIIIGTLLGIVFGASSLYLVLKVGITVSASIPVAVLAITTFRVLSKFGLRDSTILENNIVQTAGSAGESIAFGLGVTMPAIMIRPRDRARDVGRNPRGTVGHFDDDPHTARADRSPTRVSEISGRDGVRGGVESRSVG